MTKENLIILRNLILDALEQAKETDPVDRVEVMMNIYHFLNPEDYQENVRTLQLRKTLMKGENQNGRKF